LNRICPTPAYHGETDARDRCRDARAADHANDLPGVG